MDRFTRCATRPRRRSWLKASTCAEILGHASTRLTADTDAHVAPDLLSDAMQLAANALDATADQLGNPRDVTSA